MDTLWICMMAGPIVAMLVQVFKGWALVAQYPKVFALVLSGAVAVVSGLTVGDFDWASIAECVLIPFVTAIASYEVVVKEVVA